MMIKIRFLLVIISFHFTACNENVDENEVTPDLPESCAELYGGSSYWILKLGESGSIEWQKCFSGVNSAYPVSIRQTINSGYILAGTSDDGDYWILNLDNLGNVNWQKNLGGNPVESASSIQQTDDGGFIVAGTKDLIYNPNFCVLKLDKDGTTQWQQILGGTNLDYASGIQQTLDGGFVVVGSTASNDGDVSGKHGITGLFDYWVVKLDVSGKLQWQKCLGGSFDDFASSIRQTVDKGYVIAGLSYSEDGDVVGNHRADYWIVKLDELGNIQWQKCLGGSKKDWARSIGQSIDGGYYVIGITESNDGDVTGFKGGSDYWAIKLSETGGIIWQKSLGGNSYEEGHSMVQTSDGGYIICGMAMSNNGDVSENSGNADYWILKLDAVGDIQWQKNFGGQWDDVALSIQSTFDKGYIVAGYSSN